jgi:type II secretory pathway pseudopilin PulG
MKLRGAVSNKTLGASRQALVIDCRKSSAQRLGTSAFRAMTLIELLVVIVILTTLVGGVLPLVSPNNDTRKISEGVRSLQTYFMQAQAEAARIGRPVGIGFRETSAGSGVALEVYQLTVPKPYYGSSSLSRVGITKVTTSKTSDAYGGQYTPRNQRTGGFLYPQYVQSDIYGIDSRQALSDEAGVKVPDPLPPKMFRVGDTVIAQGNRFVVIDDMRCPAVKDFNSANWFVNPSLNEPEWANTLFCVRLDEVQMQDEAPPLSQPPTGYGYAIHRQPMADSATRMVSSASPLQLPSSISLDLLASGIESHRLGNIGDEPPLEDTTIPGQPVQLPYTVGLMFSPNGGIESVWINGKKITELSKMFFLIGRQENGNPPAELYTDFGGQGRTDITDNELKDRRSKVNWLNMDSKWLLVNANDGRISVSSNASFDPRDDEYSEELEEYLNDHKATGLSQIQLTRDFQIELAHGLAHSHEH